MRRLAAAMLIAGTANAAPLWAACAHAQAASPFEVVPRPQPERRSHAWAWLTAATGAGLIAGSFPLRDAADRRYDEYLVETDPARIGARWNDTIRADRLASGSLIAGEVLVATAVWLRFVHRPRPATGSPHTTLVITPERCALALRF
ncbi:MAG: hypothetical protein U0704_10700 [Candidatus Eisenbacteria bacterium]